MMTDTVARDLTTQENLVYQKYAKLALPRHTSYPTAPHWTQEIPRSALVSRLASLAQSDEPISLYLHVPYCDKLCFYCACNKEILPREPGFTDPRLQYLEGIEKEIAGLTPTLGKPLRVQELHLGGGTPTYLSSEHLRRLDKILRQSFAFEPSATLSIELDPRATTEEQVDTLVDMGFNRFSLGVQDFSEVVQKATNRMQSFEQVATLVSWLRARHVTAINFDLIYGLPFQTQESIEKTLALVLELAPDRIAFFRLALIPEIFRWQRTFTRMDLPPSDQVMGFFLSAVRHFETAGYTFIGLDHFAKSHDALTEAFHNQTLQRNFQGMATGKNLPLLGIGPSSITQLHDLYLQNEHSSKDWLKKLAQGDSPIGRGIELKGENFLRRDLIQGLYSFQGISVPQIEAAYGIDFWKTFARERVALEELQSEGICQVSDGHISLTPLLGRMLVRVVAAIFDDYLPADAYRMGLDSKAASQVG